MLDTLAARALEAKEAVRQEALAAERRSATALVDLARKNVQARNALYAQVEALVRESRDIAVALDKLAPHGSDAAGRVGFCGGLGARAQTVLAVGAWHLVGPHSLQTLFTYDEFIQEGSVANQWRREAREIALLGGDDPEAA